MSRIVGELRLYKRVYDIVCLVWNNFIIFGKRTHLKLGKVIYCFRMDCVRNLNTFHLSEDSLCVRK